MASLELVDPASAESPDRWRQSPSVGLLEGVAFRIHWFDSANELREAAKDANQDVKQTGIHPFSILKGFSILKRNKETGEYVCDVYVVKMTGAPVDGEGTRTFGHEVLHCFGLSHE